MSDERASIEDLLSAYVLSLDVDDVDGCLALFTPDASFSVYGRTFSGISEIRSMLLSAPHGLHLGGRSLIRVAGERATSRHQLAFFEVPGRDVRLAVYDDELVRDEGGVWRFHSRRCRFITPEGLSDRPYAQP